MSTRQPEWVFLGNLGDASPILHGGLFVYADKFGNYEPEMEKLYPPMDEIDMDDPSARWTVYRASITRCTIITGKDLWEQFMFEQTGVKSPDEVWREMEREHREMWESRTIISDNHYHPLYPAWFAKPEYEKRNRPQDTTYLSNVANAIGSDIYDPLGKLRAALCDSNILGRAMVYRDIAEYHGWENFDENPLELTREEVEKRYTDGELKR